MITLTSEKMDQDLYNEYLSEDMIKNSIADQITKTIALGVGEKYASYVCRRRIEKHKTDFYRIGPAPIEESETIRKSTYQLTKATYGTLDSDLEDLDFEELRSTNLTTNYFKKTRVTTNESGFNLASCRALIVYFSKLAKTRDEEELIDLNFVESLLDGGADINFSDKHGQTVMHEIARGWHPDIAKFAIEHGADINKSDGFGRTPLHLAAAVDYEEMVEFLVDNEADLTSQTEGELQTPMHYAAKNNASNSLKVMLRLGAHINDRDYKKRTPLFVAAETARADAARFLIEQGAPCGVYDSSGTSCLSLMIEKMPQIALEAVEQFHMLDRAFRKHYYYLSYLEPDPNYLVDYIPEVKREQREHRERRRAEKKLMKERGQRIVKKEKTHAKTPLEVIVQYNQLDLIMHPVFQRLLHVKWNLFGKWGSAKLLAINMFYTCIWTILGILIPRDRKYYQPFADNWWRLVLELIGVTLTVYFIFMEISQLRTVESAHNRWRQWRTRHMEKDLEYCHPRWPEERQYLTSELEQIRTYQRTYFREPWNIFEWAAYVVILVLVLTRVLSVASGDKHAEEVHPRIYALGLIVIWLRFMRSCRVFRTLGPFIAILGSVIADTMKFAFLFFEFFIPYTVAFWILFGGHMNADKMDESSHQNWKHLNDLTYSVWMMTLMGPFDWPGLTQVDRLMAQILCGTYFALAGVVCMNLYIALLSDTFARVYAQAKANAVMQQARIIILLEKRLNKFYRSKYGHHMQRECSPQEVYTRDESDEDLSHDDFDRIGRQITKRINELEESILHCKQHDAHSAPTSDARNPSRNSIIKTGQSDLHENDDVLTKNRKIEAFMLNQNVHNTEMKYEIDSLKVLTKEIRSLLQNSESLSYNRYPVSDLSAQQLQKTTSSGHSTHQNALPSVLSNNNVFNSDETNMLQRNPTTDRNASLHGLGNGFKRFANESLLSDDLAGSASLERSQSMNTKYRISKLQSQQPSIYRGSLDRRDGKILRRADTADVIQNLYPTLPLQNGTTKVQVNGIQRKEIDDVSEASNGELTRSQSRNRRRRRKKKGAGNLSDQQTVEMDLLNLYEPESTDNVPLNVPLLRSASPNTSGAPV